MIMLFNDMFFSFDGENIEFNSDKYEGDALNFVIIKFNPKYTEKHPYTRKNLIRIQPEFSVFDCNIKQTQNGFYIPSNDFAEFVDELKITVSHYHWVMNTYKTKFYTHLIDEVKVVNYDKIDNKWVETSCIEISDLKHPFTMFNDKTRIDIYDNTLFINGNEITG